jgi:aminoglycoside 6-adenylyltransferase
MRNPQEMLDLILETARADERIRAVILDGSRADPSSPCDPFQDFDIIYVTTDVEFFRNNLDWIKRFGEIMILQLPNEMQNPPPDELNFPVYLMQFMDGNRIDLTIMPVGLAGLERNCIRRILLDKDGAIDSDSISDEKAYLPHPPTAKQFADCTNEFWWVSPYVAKGLWRSQIVYAHQMLDSFVREQLNLMLKWYIGMKTDGKEQPGKFGKYFQRWLEPELWGLLKTTYAGTSEDEIWQALFSMCTLFRRTAGQVATKYGFSYPSSEDARVSDFLKHIQQLDRKAEKIY